MTESLWTDEAIRARGKIARMGTLLAERRGADALAIADQIAPALDALACDAPDAPVPSSFRLKHASLLLRRGHHGGGGPSDAERARMLIERVARDAGVVGARSDPTDIVRADDRRTRELPSLLLAFNSLGQHKLAADMFERVMKLHRSPSTRFHAARLNAGMCRSSEALAAWAAGDLEEASEAVDRAIELLSAEADDGAPHLAAGDAAAREASVMLRESNLLNARLLRFVIDGRDQAALIAHVAAVNDLLDRSERNSATPPVSLKLRYGRLADALSEIATAVADAHPERSRAYASAALVYFSPRRELWRIDNDLPFSLVVRWSQASALAGDPQAACDMLQRGRMHLAARYGHDYPGLQLLEKRLQHARDAACDPRDPRGA